MGAKVAVVGAGPAGIYAVEALLKQLPNAEVDVFERTHAPYGLVRYGVAPDHQKIKSVTRAFDKILGDERVQFFGNVVIGGALTARALADAYDAVIYTTGSGRRRDLGIPGENLRGYHGAPEFVAWYNGHPDFADYRPSLRTRSAAVIGAGNVSMDVSRMLLLDYEAVQKTDVPNFALEEFKHNAVRDVHVFIRRGPEQVAFDFKELRDIIEMPGVTVVVRREDIPEPLPKDLSTADQKKLELLAGHAHDSPPSGGKRMFLHFFRSPAKISGDGVVEEIRVEHTRVDGKSAVGTGEFTTIEVGLVVSAAGYKGSPIEGIPFDPKSATIPNVEGRIIGPEGKPIPGHYVAGWIKRGPSGVIGTNKACAVDTVKNVILDLESASSSDKLGRVALGSLLERARVRPISWADWKRLDAAEVLRGQAAGKVREKFLNVEDCFTTLDG